MSFSDFTSFTDLTEFDDSEFIRTSGMALSQVVVIPEPIPEPTPNPIVVKSQSETDREILVSAKIADELPNSEIRIRHTRSVHPVQCYCTLHRKIRFEDFSSKNEINEKEILGWYKGD